MNFLRDLRVYDKDNIPVSVKIMSQLKKTFNLHLPLTYSSVFGLQVHVMQKIRSEYMTNPDFNPSIVAKASSAAEGLCKWIQAMEVYDRVAKVQCLWIFKPLVIVPAHLLFHTFLDFVFGFRLWLLRRPILEWHRSPWQLPWPFWTRRGLSWKKLKIA